jgi:hypothetical protein
MDNTATSEDWTAGAWWLNPTAARSACQGSTRCLHHVAGSKDVRCCNCGIWEPDPNINPSVMPYRLDTQHIPSGPYYPSILSANR